MSNLNINIEYIYNSGFTIETENHFLIIDYYKGDLNIKKDKNTTFFVSHGHEDHFNEIIFDYKDHANYVISDDIDNLVESDNLKLVHPGDEIQFNNMDIKVFDSTDLGSSFYIKVDGVNIFHAGDLNWWAWEDSGEEKEKERERNYKREIDKLKSLNIPIDIGFVPVDPRLEHNFHLAGEYFIETINPKYFFPMHFGDNYSMNEKFIHKMKDKNTHIIIPTMKNQSFQINIK